MNIETVSRLAIEPSNYCNARCPQCARAGHTHDGLPLFSLKHLDLDTFFSNIDKEKLLNLKSVILEGDRGDPIMHPNLFKLIEFFDWVPNIFMFTNGGVRNTDWWEKLAQYPNLTVVWSIDGLADTNHLYRIGTDFDKIIKNATTFINAGGHAIWRCIIFKHNQHQIGEITNFSKKLGFTATWVVSANPGRFYGLDSWPVYQNGVITHELALSDFSDAVIRSKTKIHSQQSRMVRLNESLVRPDLKCPWAQLGKITINCYGHVLPCCMRNAEPFQQHEPSQLLPMIDNDWDNISVYKHHLEDILKQEFYASGLENSLKSVDTMHDICRDSCGSKIHKNFTNTSKSTIIPIQKNTVN
jgi:MoaA/NifB/PqqE/SkfB family radical SAM enzyme